jgi:diadenosine tetraphosphate (Ap4A) HIT family hydrolase
MLQSRVMIGVLAFVAGVAAGGYLFANSQPRSFLAVGNCRACYRPNDLAGLLVSAGIQRAPSALPRVVKESDRCIAIEHPFARRQTHYVVFPKKDIRDIADISRDDEPYVIDCLATIRALVVENGFRNYRVLSNGPDLQDITYLHFHLISRDSPSRLGPGAANENHDVAVR